MDEEFTTRGKSVSTGTVASPATGTGTPSTNHTQGLTLTERMVDVSTADGTCDSFFVHPAQGKHPGIIFWPDIGGLREVKKAMARLLAEQGYAVLVINQYYRGGHSAVLADMPDRRSPEGRAVLEPMIATVTPEGVARDGALFVAFLDSQAAVDRGRGIGTHGYCMGGPFAVRTAAAAPQRVRAAASFHGGGLVTDQPNSPHRLLAVTQASYLIAVAQNDDARASEAKNTFREAAAAAGRPAEVEVYAADHGWCVSASPAYNRAEAERAFERLLALYATL